MKRKMTFKKIGSNQYEDKYKLRHTTWPNLVILPVLALSFWGLHNLLDGTWTRFEDATTYVSPVSTRMESPLPDDFLARYDKELESKAPTLLKQKTVSTLESGQRSLEKYICRVFGDDCEVAIAISRKECGPRNPQYPMCVASSDIEYSVGLFQVNLFNSKGWVHAGRIPGDTMEEKIEWIEDPFNNIHYAKQLRDSWGSFQPWSAFTNQAYAEELPNISREDYR